MKKAVLFTRRFHLHNSSTSVLVVQLKPNIQSQQSRVLVKGPRQVGQSVVGYLRMCAQRVGRPDELKRAVLLLHMKVSPPTSPRRPTEGNIQIPQSVYPSKGRVKRVKVVVQVPKNVHKSGRTDELKRAVLSLHREGFASHISLQCGLGSLSFFPFSVSSVASSTHSSIKAVKRSKAPLGSEHKLRLLNPIRKERNNRCAFELKIGGIPVALLSPHSRLIVVAAELAPVYVDMLLRAVHAVVPCGHMTKNESTSPTAHGSTAMRCDLIAAILS